jgi:hypothetical protein
MFNLPDDIQWYIWRTYFSNFVRPEIEKNHKSIWKTPSFRLLHICKDPGCIEWGHNDLPDLIDPYHIWVWKSCEKNCGQCRHSGFPCAYLANFGFRIPQLAMQWSKVLPRV